jgi:hypothetical protein
MCSSSPSEKHLGFDAAGGADPHEVLQGYPQPIGGLGLPQFPGELAHQLERVGGGLSGEIQSLLRSSEFAPSQCLVELQALDTTAISWASRSCRSLEGRRLSSDRVSLILVSR